MRKQTLNDNDRRQWVNNDEGLYNWWKCSRQSMTQFIRENRAELDVAINNILNPPPKPTRQNHVWPGSIGA